MKVAKIALRNLTRQKRRSLFLVCAIAFGVFIVTLVNGFSAGAVRILKENFAEMMGAHVFVALQHKEGDRTVSVIDDERPLVDALHGLGVRDSQLSRSVQLQQALIVNGSKSEIMGVIGIDWATSPSLAERMGLPDDVYARLKDGTEGIVLSKKMAEKLNIAAGDGLLVRGETITGQANVGEIVVAYVTKDKSDTSTIYSFASKSFVNAFLDLPDAKAYTNLGVRLASLDLADPFAVRLKEALKGTYALTPKSAATPGMESSVFKMGDGSGTFEGVRASVSTINEFLSQVTQLSVGLQIAAFVMLALLLIITMIGIANTFRMIMYERVREIGTMRAVGMKRRQVRRLFLMEALFLALAGVAAGIVVGFVATTALSLVDFGTESFFALFLQNGHLSFLIRFVDVALIVVLVSGFTLLAAQGPARKAAKKHPADALRTSF